LKSLLKNKMSDQYRRCVGMMILNTNNEILVGRRLDHPSGYWQMPQGGIDEDENPEEAVWREMMEEIGTNNAELFKTSNQWVKYDIPQETLDKYRGGKYGLDKSKNGSFLNFQDKRVISMLKLKTQNLANGNG